MLLQTINEFIKTIIKNINSINLPKIKERNSTVFFSCFEQKVLDPYAATGVEAAVSLTGFMEENRVKTSTWFRINLGHFERKS